MPCGSVQPSFSSFVYDHQPSPDNTHLVTVRTGNMLLRKLGILRPFTAAHLARSHRSQHTQSVVTQDKVYELRTYAIWPQHVKEFLNLTSEEFHLRTSQSKLIGYWTSELGGLNEVVHIWEYDSLEHRAQVRASLAGNTEWIQRYFAKILPWMSGQQNAVISVIPGIPLNNSKEKGIYQLQTLNFSSNAQKTLTENSTILNCNNGDILVGAFQTVHGNLNSRILLWKHQTLSAASQLIMGQMKNNSWKEIAGGYSKILVPHKVSPLQ